MSRIIIYSLLVALCFSCKESYTPKPRGHFRIDFPEKEYRLFSPDCPYQFEYPVYGQIEAFNNTALSQGCWFNINFAKYKAKIHLTYIPLNGNLSKHSEDIRKIVYKHIVKANDIKETRLDYPSEKKYGILYTISGNTASSLSFLLTDSTSHFLSGSLYFSSIPNYDSLQPAIQFFTEDVVHLTSSLVWK